MQQACPASHLDAFEAAAWCTAFEYKPANAFPADDTRLLTGPSTYYSTVIGRGSRCNQLDTLIYKAQRFARNAQGRFKFRADQNPFGEPPEVAGQKFVL